MKYLQWAEGGRIIEHLGLNLAMASPHRTRTNSLRIAVINSLKSAEQAVVPQSRPVRERMAKGSSAKGGVVKETKRKFGRRVSLVDGEEIVESRKKHNSQDDSHTDVNEDANDGTKDEESDGNTDGVLQLLEKRSRMSIAKQVQITIRIYNRLHLRATQVMKIYISYYLHRDVLMANYSSCGCSLCWLC